MGTWNESQECLAKKDGADFLSREFINQLYFKRLVLNKLAKIDVMGKRSREGQGSLPHLPPTYLSLASKISIALQLLAFRFSSFCFCLMLTCGCGVGRHCNGRGAIASSKQASSKFHLGLFFTNSAEFFQASFTEILLQYAPSLLASQHIFASKLSLSSETRHLHHNLFYWRAKKNSENNLHV